jgi:hypothetical protein
VAVPGSSLSARGGSLEGTAFDTIGCRADGTEFPIEGSYGEYTDDQLYFTWIVRDVSGRKALEEARELALGDRDYVDDIRMDGMLHAMLRLTDHARADIVRIDTSRAQALQGVLAERLAVPWEGDSQ